MFEKILEELIKKMAENGQEDNDQTNIFNKIDIKTT